MFSQQQEKITRRSFLDWFIGGSLLISLGGVLTTAVGFVFPPARRGKLSGKEFIEVATTDELPPNAHKKVAYNGKPVYIINTGHEYVALSAICTHLGCIVHMKNDSSSCNQNMPANIIHCICHAAVFDVNGNVVSGPAPRPLPRYQLRISEDTIYLGGLMGDEQLYSA